MDSFFLSRQPELFAQPIQAVVFSVAENQLPWIECMGTLWSTKLYPTCQVDKLVPGVSVTVMGRIGNSLLITTS